MKLDLFKNRGATKIVAILLFTVALGAGLWISTLFMPFGRVTYTEVIAENLAEVLPEIATSSAIKHIKTPEQVKAVYLSSWAAGSEKFRKPLSDILDNTEVNAVVIDIKDYTGKLSFHVNDDPYLVEFGAGENRIPDIKEFIEKLHEKNIYVIGRISCFQDSFLIKSHPEWAVKSKASGGVWADYKNVKWLDAAATPVWDYLVAIGKYSYDLGFDELNFDYIRYPSDGNMKDVSYSWGEGKTRSEVMRSFFMHLREQFVGVPISADLFGLTTSASDDLGIGQNLADALPYFDYIAPMVYPSHFSKGFNGYAKPAQYPYEVVKYSMEHAIDKSYAASTSPHKIRPWLQAFDYGAIYAPELVRAQFDATYDSGLNSWMLWDAASIYDRADFLPKGTKDKIADLPPNPFEISPESELNSSTTTTTQNPQPE